ncbi:DUF4169 family protein [Sneathiella sp.]|uniref:DUF4169 family protein n=1 Tax=Sneathiella sp. TaxID=1964365 RepID=UPI0035614367
MGDVVSLNQFRKKHDRKITEKKARENRILFGRTSTEKKSDKDQKSKNTLQLDQKKLERLPTDKDDDSI